MCDGLSPWVLNLRDQQDVGPDTFDEVMEAAAADRPVFRLDAAA
jgi:hypothetical protein